MNNDSFLIHHANADLPYGKTFGDMLKSKGIPFEVSSIEISERYHINTYSYYNSKTKKRMVYIEQEKIDAGFDSTCSIIAYELKINGNTWVTEE